MNGSLAQRCYLVNVYASYVLLAVVTAFVAWWSGPIAALVTAAVGIGGLYLYVRTFPSISRFIGYGRVDDKAVGPAPHAATRVRLYTAVGCPFCPIVRRRLHDLRERMGFDLEEIDVTTRPDLLVRRGIRAVPVVEVGARVHIGHATTDELALLISGGSAP